MRPVKKALRALDNPDQNLSESEQVTRTRACLTQIGTQIDICLEAYPDPEKKVEWRSNLWYFVSKFTNFDAKQLYKLYKYGLKKNVESKQKGGKHKENVKVNVTCVSQNSILLLLKSKYFCIYFIIFLLFRRITKTITTQIIM